MAMASSSGTRCEIDVEVDSPKMNITALDFGGECSLESGDGAQQEVKVRDEGVAARHSFSGKLFRYFGGWFCGAESSPERSWYYSERIQRMIESRGECKSDVESTIESSRIHWSQVDTTAMLEREQTRKTNREYFEVLKRRKYVRQGDQIVAMQCIDEDELPEYSLFESGWDDLEVGEKLAEGGQAEIYTLKNQPHVVVKVFKEGSVLQELEKQWPLALLKHHQFDPDPTGSPLLLTVMGATLLRSERLGWEDRFAFVMTRCWGDLRMLIDQRMIRSQSQGPPFSPSEVSYIMTCIAFHMISLHAQQPPILHKDLKAANVLLNVKVGRGGRVELLAEKDGILNITVVDYECSVGVVGTGFWRAPEILQQLKDKVPASELVFSKECDVYSFGMTCYELVSGRIPFEDYQELPKEGCDLVLKGERPELPPGLDGMIKEVITSCWDPIPSKRPTFEKIWNILQ